MNIDPIDSAFFSTEALDSLADALVREAIQNSLDARAPGTRGRSHEWAGLFVHVV